MKEKIIPIIIFLLLGWALVSFRWYTCGIKGFCSLSQKKEIHQNINTKMKVYYPVKKVTTVPKSYGTAIRIAEMQAVSCAPYIVTDIKVTQKNNSTDVERLEEFFERYEKLSMHRDGVFDTYEANQVKVFQQKYFQDIISKITPQEPTGHVLGLTRNKINELYCSLLQN